MTELLPHVDACPLLAGLPTAGRRALAAQARLQHYQAGRQIYPPGAMESRLSIVAAGRVRICSGNTAGREATLAILDRGAWFGDTIFSPGMPRVFGATAHEDCQVVEVAGEVLRRLMAEYPEAYPVVLDMVSRRLWSAMSIIQDDVLRGTEARVARRLLFLAQMHNPAGVTGGKRGAVCFGMTRELLANMMGMSRQGLHRVLKAIETEGLVEFDYGRLTIPDPDRLQAHIEQLD